MLYHEARQWLAIDINPGGFWLGAYARWRRLFNTEAVGAVVRDIEPSHRRDFQSVFRATMAAVPETVESIGLLAAFGHETSVHDQGLCMLRRNYRSECGLVERDKVK